MVMHIDLAELRRWLGELEQEDHEPGPSGRDGHQFPADEVIE